MAKTLSLIELATVLAIVSVLAALAIPALHEAELKAKATELPTNLDGMWDAMWAYEAAMDQFPSAAPQFHPMMNTLGKKARSWDPAPAWWSTFGWRPDGDVRGSYKVEISYAASVITVDGFTDLDEDGDWRWMTRNWYWATSQSGATSWCGNASNDHCF